MLSILGPYYHEFSGMLDDLVKLYRIHLVLGRKDAPCTLSEKSRIGPHTLSMGIVSSAKGCEPLRLSPHRAVETRSLSIFKMLMESNGRVCEGKWRSRKRLVTISVNGREERGLEY